MLFLETFFTTQFSGINFSRQDLHIAGESYAVHYVPNIACAVMERQPPFHLKSIMIGNGWYDAFIQQGSFYQMICDPALTLNVNRLLSPPECAAWAIQLTICETAIEGCRADTSICSLLSNSCENVEAGLYEQMRSLDKYDLSNSISPVSFAMMLRRGRSFWRTTFSNTGPT